MNPNCLEIQALFAQNIVVGFGRIEGHSVGVIANQPQQLAGTLDINSVRKPLASCVSAMLSAFPIITLVDAGLPSWHRTGMERRHSPWCEDFIRLW